MVAKNCCDQDIKEYHKYDRVTCINCGKLLFKKISINAQIDFEETKKYIEIKCNNRICKTINVIEV